MSDYEKLDVFKPDLTKARTRLEELKRLEAKQKAKEYPIMNGTVMTVFPERWEEFIIK